MEVSSLAVCKEDLEGNILEDIRNNTPNLLLFPFPGEEVPQDSEDPS
jgi:hypothetical protein